MALDDLKLTEGDLSLIRARGSWVGELIRESVCAGLMGRRHEPRVRASCLFR